MATPHALAVRSIMNKGAMELAPNLLRALQYFIVAWSLVTGLIGFGLWRSLHQTVQTIGYDSAPSVIAAENIRSTLSDAHNNLIKAFVSGQGVNGQNVADYRAAMESVNNYIVTATQNITYGNEEREPIVRALNNLSLYQTLVGSAMSSSGNIYDVRAADDIVREHIIPAVDDLAAANDAHLEQAYAARGGELFWMNAFMFCSAVLASILVYIQFYLKKTFRRLFNPAAALGTIVMVLSALSIIYNASSIGSDLKVAKEDAFDSVIVLSKAKAVAYSGLSQEGIYLLATDSYEKADAETNFNKSSEALISPKLVNGPFGQNIVLLTSSEFHQKGVGLLTDEMSNVTFPNEESAAKENVRSWLAYLKEDSHIRDMETSGNHAGAVADYVDLGLDDPDLSKKEGTFGQFIAALDITTKINQDQFDQAIADSVSNAQLLWMSIITLVLGPILGAVIGLQLRIAEFHE